MKFALECLLVGSGWACLAVACLLVFGGLPVLGVLLLSGWGLLVAVVARIEEACQREEE